jgi:ATP-dependent Clp protease, protease subunit
MARSKTELENFLVYGVDEKNRKVYFGVALAHAWDEGDIGGFSQCAVEYSIRAIERMAKEYPKTPIEIHMNSYGGDPYAMLALYDVIHNASCQIKFYGKGAIMSAATWIMAGCDERYLHSNTTVMVHNGWMSAEGALTNVIIATDEEKRLQDKLEEIYAANSRMPKEFWAKVCQRDLYLSAEETIKLGLADRIVKPKARGSLRKIRSRHLMTKVDRVKMKKLTDNLLKRIKMDPIREIVVNDYKPEQIDERLTIEPIKVEEETNVVELIEDVEDDKE